LLPSIDFDELEARQSDIRNKVIAPIFKRVGLIDQWGNGLKLIADELKTYPEIEFRWFERGGLQFQVQFINKDYVAQQKLLDIDGTIDGAIDGTIGGATRSLRKKLSVLLKAIWNNEGRRLPDYIETTNLGSQRTVERYMQQLREAGLVEFKGQGLSTGGYYVTDALRSKLS